MTGIVQPSTPPRIHVSDNESSTIRTDGVFVLFTTAAETLAAARIAAAFADAMGVPLTIVHFRVVPYPLAVDGPVGISPVETDAFVASLEAQEIDAHVRVILCRQAQPVLPVAFSPRSLVVIAGRRSWWPTRTERWRRRLEAAGHFVVFVDRAPGGRSEEKTHA